MNDDLVINKDILEHPVSDVPVYEIADKFRALLINPDMTRDMAIQVIYNDYLKRYQNAVKRDVDILNQYRVKKDKLHSEIQELENNYRANVANSNIQIGVLKNILKLRHDLNTVIPAGARGISDAYINDFDRWAQRVMSHLGFWDKIKFRRNNVVEKYNQLIQATRAAGLAVVPDVDMITRMERDMSESISILGRHIDDIRRKIAHTESVMSGYTDNINRARQQYSDEMNRDIVRFLSVFHKDPRERRALQKIPPFVGIQNLTEPVAFFQNIDTKYAPESYLEKIATIMRRAGLKVATYDSTDVSDPATYVLRQYNDWIELMTPFYSPSVARKEVTALMKYLASYGVKFIGAVHPATQWQIDPRISNARYNNADKIAALIKDKLKNAISRDDFIRQHNDKNMRGKFLFRGHNFITPDVKSSYATPTWRPGRSGLAYATDDASYAYGYTGGANTQNMAGETVKPQSLHTSSGDIPVGFLTVYKGNKKNIIVDNVELESMDTSMPGAFRELAQKNKLNPETAITPTLNPVVARYLVSGDKW